MQPSWRSVLPVHPAAELFPPLGNDELHRLGADIRKHGLREPVVLQRRYRRRADGSIANEHDYELVLVDGRNRLDAMERAGFALICDGKLDKTLGHRELGLEPLTGGGYAELDSDVDPYAFVISRNIHRRHLTAEQKRELIGKLIKAQPEKSNRQIADTAKASPTTVGAVRAKMEARGDVSKLDTRRDSKGRRQPANKPRKSPTTKPLGPDSSGEAKPELVVADHDVCRVVVDCVADVTARVNKALATSIDAEQRARLFARLHQAIVDLEHEDIDNHAHVAPAADDGLDIPACLRRSAGS
jgi:hypothetical protein